MDYDRLGNLELRDKYIDIALMENPSDNDVIYLRGMQGRPDLVPEKVAERELAVFGHRDGDAASVLVHMALGNKIEAAYDYVRGLAQSVATDNPFSVAFYLVEMEDRGVREILLEDALRRASAAGDLWWQVRGRRAGLGERDRGPDDPASRTRSARAETRGPARAPRRR